MQDGTLVRCLPYTTYTGITIQMFYPNFFLEVIIDVGGGIM